MPRAFLSIYQYILVCGKKSHVFKQWPGLTKVSYTPFKLHRVELAERTSKSSATKEFNVDVRRVQEWCKQKASSLFFNKYHETRELQRDTCPMIWSFFFVTVTAYLSCWLPSSACKWSISWIIGVQTTLYAWYLVKTLCFSRIIW